MTPTTSVPEATREEETLRYAASLLSESIIRDSPTPQHPQQRDDSLRLPLVSADPALAAFAQLAALRLPADRVFISLFDAKRQHIVAEATPSTIIEGTPAYGDDQPDPSLPYDENTAIFFSGTAIPRGHGACELVLDMPPVVHHGVPVLPIAMISDLTQDVRFNSRRYFQPGSPLRFYAGVPIRSPQGIDIGVCCIIHSEPRDGLTLPQQRLLRHISILTMAHLQSRATAESYRRNERMVRGLGSLVEGTGSMSRWRGAPNPTSFADVEGKEGALNAQQQHIQRHGRPEITYKGPPRITDSTEFVPGVDSASASTSTPTPTLGPASTSGIPQADDDLNRGKNSFTTYPENQADEDMIVLKMLFSRAANIIRESIEVEGVLFLDAAIGSYGGLVQQASKEGEEQQLESSSSGGESAGTDESKDGTAACGVMGFSNSGTSSINGDSPTVEHTTVPETFLARLLRRYPEGQVFNFGEDGQIRWAISSESDSADSEGADSTESPTDTKSEPKPDAAFYRHPRSRKGDGAVLQRLFPKSRSVAVFPLWDSHKEKWHAAGLVWTMASARMFTVTGELSYLRAFGSSVMAEVARIDVLRADKAKEDVLGSLSHEIRSPLHGIILGLELMHDTALDVFQQDVLHTVETCGRTLLDTMDHLLDFSKVNHFLRAPKRSVATSRSRGMGGSPGARNTIEASMMSLFSDVSLDALLEEVVESIYAGFSFQQFSNDWANRDRGTKTSIDQAGSLRRLESVRHMDNDAAVQGQRPEAGVAVYLSIDPTVAWNFHAQPGALRRVIMNIFGNALKYTTRGSILVSLTQEPSLIKKRSRRRSVIFSVSDSGRGISSDFLQNRLFVPFTQENQLASGSGLGLSIVKQIVHGLSGRIGVESKAGHGTTVRVSLPLRIAPPPASPPASGSPHRDMSFKESLKQLEGVQVSLLGFESDFGPDRPLAADSADARLCPRLFMETLCRHYLGLNVLSELDEALTDPSASMLICTQKALAQLVDLNQQDQMRPVVVICGSILSAHELSSRPTTAPFPIYISQPVGPRKLAKSLTIALQRLDKARASRAAGPTGNNSNHNNNQHPDESKTSTSDFAPHGKFPALSRKSSVVRPTTESSLSGSDRGNTPTPSKVEGLALPDRTLEKTDEDDVPTRPPERPQPAVLQSYPTVSEDQHGPTPDLAPTPASDFFETPVTPQKRMEDTNAFLLVDDNAINLKILASYMKKLGRSHDNAMNGLEALEACRSRQTHYKCIFMDISMPVMDGLEATRHIRTYEKQRAWDPALVIALTGLGSSKTQQEAFASGIDLFLTKPVPLKELGRILESRHV